jgi:hypothetical protein
MSLVICFVVYSSRFDDYSFVLFVWYPFLFKLKNTTAYKKHLVYWGEKIFSCLVLMSTVILDLLTVEMWSLYITE